MALSATALATFADAQALFGYASDEQTKVELLIETASARMEVYCRRKLAARDFGPLYLIGTGSSRILLPEYPINSISRLCIDDDRAFAAADDLEPSAYSLRIEVGELWLYAGIFGIRDRPDVVLVSGNAGYASSHPNRAILRNSCLEYVDWLKSRFAAPGSIGKRGEYSADRVSVSYEIEMPMHIRASLDPFARVTA